MNKSIDVGFDLEFEGFEQARAKNALNDDVGCTLDVTSTSCRSACRLGQVSYKTLLALVIIESK